MMFNINNLEKYSIIYYSLMDIFKEMKKMEFKKFLQDNKRKIEILAERNCKRNEDGKVVIEKQDPSFLEDNFEEHYNEIMKEEKTCK